MKSKQLVPKKATRSARNPPPRPTKVLSGFAAKLDAAFRDVAERRIMVREVEIAGPSGYQPADVRRTRDRLGVSVAVFGQLLGVSPKLVEHWEQGRRVPSPLASRLLDRVNADPKNFLADLLTARKHAG